ncbi:TMEM175 family protein [Streptomyces sp. NPDC091377]|uniref:TMEM175 family protein n=1 Tax=Streptomyces sp. NPDC091377 TaxID=3365995 RepID=UPI00380299D8
MTNRSVAPRLHLRPRIRPRIRFRRGRATTVEAARLAAFGDAVFAIAITLLALGITVPEGLPDAKVAQAVRDAVPAIAGFGLSFAVIGALWLAQHALFRHIATLDHLLLYAYFGLLAVVAALPFPTRLLNQYGETVIATVIYAGAITLASGLMSTMYLRLLAVPSLAAPHTSRARLKASCRHSLLLVLVFGTSIPVAFASPSTAKYWWVLAIPARLLSQPPREPAQGPPGGTSPGGAPSGADRGTRS